ncbi:inositol monophosphatase family protein [Fodinicurvata sp. EGI_FJ10296]|uniref:inositol monophosphatase family protein n=1 Tax=Fodinicurvata sp. EGI_FJ10296 TaxID=3231908 RepID=UPI003451F1DC
MTSLPAGTSRCPDALINLADRLADAAAAAIRPYWRTPFPVDIKADASPVTAADRDAEMAMRRIVAAERPDHGMIGEEFGAERDDATYVWVFDPIDGTKAFMTGKPTFGTLIALLEDGVPILGVIDQPIVGDRWIGAVGHRTLLNGVETGPRSCPTLARAVITTTAPDLFDDAAYRAFRTVADQCAVRVYGGDCTNYGLLASGFVDVVIENGLKLHDFAALVPVIDGAGGLLVDWQGAPLRRGSDGTVLALGDRSLLAPCLEILSQ